VTEPREPLTGIALTEERSSSGTGTLRLDWDAITFDGPGLVTYTVERRITDADDEETYDWQDVDHTQSPFEIGLHPPLRGETYHFRIQGTLLEFTNPFTTTYYESAVVSYTAGSDAPAPDPEPEPQPSFDTEGVVDLREYLGGKDWNVGVSGGPTKQLPAVYVTFGTPSFASGRVRRVTTAVVELLVDYAGGRDPDKDIEELATRLANDLWANKRWTRFTPDDAYLEREFPGYVGRTLWVWTIRMDALP